MQRILKLVLGALTMYLVLATSASASGTRHMRNSNASPPWTDYTLTFGNPGEHAVTGDWDGNGTDTIGTFKDGLWYLTNMLALR